MKKFVSKGYGGKYATSITKSKDDIVHFAEEIGYAPLPYFAYQWPEEPQEFLAGRFDGMLASVGYGDLIFHQYPSKDYGLDWDIAYINRLKASGCKIILLIQDIEFIGYLSQQGGDLQKKEIEFYNHCDVLISHSKNMTKALYDCGVTRPIVEKPVWDYIVREADFALPESLDIKKELVWAGNPEKAPFLKNWPIQTDIKYFGQAINDLTNEHVQPQGMFWHDELIRRMPKDCFGLVWSENIGDHIFKDYERWNAPHKGSLYLSLGLPVVIWEEAATAEIIKKYKVGFTIKNLEELDDKLASLSLEDMQTMKKNANHFAKMVREGMFTREALIKAERIIYDQDFDTIPALQ